jgi:hypothetical protein
MRSTGSVLSSAKKTSSSIGSPGMLALRRASYPMHREEEGIAGVITPAYVVAESFNSVSQHKNKY